MKLTDRTCSDNVTETCCECLCNQDAVSVCTVSAAAAARRWTRVMTVVVIAFTEIRRRRLGLRLRLPHVLITRRPHLYDITASHRHTAADADANSSSEISAVL